MNAPGSKDSPRQPAPQGRTFDARPPRRARPGMTMHPRKVKGGERVKWAGVREPEDALVRRIIALAEASAAPEDFEEGMDYARRGQTVAFEVNGTLASASIQGRAERPYATSLRFSPIPEDVWRQAAGRMAGEAIYAAGLLAGEISDRVDALFAAVGRPLVPTTEDVKVSCSCGHSAGWCKHACALAALVADRLSERAFLLFQLRGFSGEALLERIRDQAESAEPEAIATPVYEAHVPDAPTARGKPLEACLERFWDAGPELDTIATPIEPPKVSHPLLRRLGPSPFKEWRFPLVGLLATCYDVMGEANLDAEASEEGGPGAEESPGGL